jgi:type IV secretory pathway VirB10-like protein
MRWLITVVVIAIIAFVGYRYFYTDEGQQVAEQAEDTTEEAGQAVEEDAQQATEAVEGATDEAADTAEEAGDTAEQDAEEATGALEGATDEAADTAEEATESTEQAAEEAADSAEQTAESAEETTAALTVDGVNLGEEIGTSVSDTVGALEGISDKASAEAALPSLQAVEGRLDELSGDVEQLPQHAKEALASLLDDSLPELQDLVSKVEGIEGVGEVVKPTLDGIMAKLDAWADQPA